MQTIIKKWGNSPSVRIPAVLMKQAQLSVDSVVDVSVDNGNIVLKPMREKPDLASLLAQITPENCHSETDFGAAVGNEIW